MEEVKILEFISSGYGDGSGHGYSSGNGDCDGYGYGYGHGYGSGNSDGDGYGSGYGDCDGSGHDNCYGYGLKSINGKKIYMVDDIATAIRHIHGNIAKGTIVNNDLTETPCFIVKEGKYFAHGKTLAEANAALQDKLFDEMSPRSI